MPLPFCVQHTDLGAGRFRWVLILVYIVDTGIDALYALTHFCRIHNPSVAGQTHHNADVTFELKTKKNGLSALSFSNNYFSPKSLSL